MEEEMMFAAPISRQGLQITLLIAICQLQYSGVFHGVDRPQIRDSVLGERLPEAAVKRKATYVFSRLVPLSFHGRVPPVVVGAPAVLVRGLPFRDGRCLALVPATGRSQRSLLLLQDTVC